MIIKYRVGFGPTETMTLPSYINSIELSAEQSVVFQAFKEKQNVLLTGPAGTGKSVTLQAIVTEADKNNLVYGVTATTGAAAVLIGGRTLHSFLGIGLAKKDPKLLADWLKMKFPVKATMLRELVFLIIDEVSMMSDELFEYCSMFLQSLRGNAKPFGGIQLILSGDFAQLKPVKGAYAFKSKEWERCKFRVVLLKKIFRQHGDASFAEMLQRLRAGKCSRADFAALETRIDAPLSAHVEPTKLYSLNANVDEINSRAFNKLLMEEKPVTYVTQYDDQQDSKRWATSCGIPDQVVLCKNAQVVVTWNVDPDAGIVNGSRGRVTHAAATYVEIELVDGKSTTIGYYEASNTDEHNKKLASRFMPLKLAYALTIHKSQGMTLDCVEIDLGDSIFEYGQAYVALSRARTLSSVRIVSLSKRAFRTHPDVLKFYNHVAPATL
jgi:ATP-dependent DNA helicase PIF1